MTVVFSAVAANAAAVAIPFPPFREIALIGGTAAAGIVGWRALLNCDYHRRAGDNFMPLVDDRKRGKERQQKTCSNRVKDRHLAASI
jgi:hypothetical protein